VRLWPRLLMSVLDVRMTYDDGYFQEFTTRGVTLEGRPGLVRQVRRCEADHIEYFYPEPLPYLQHHCGDWLVYSLGPRATHLISVHRWTRRVYSGADSCPQRNAPPRVLDLLREHSRSELSAWKDALEHTAQVGK
jgi:hypothetical protein